MDYQKAVKKTLVYASYFNFPLSPEETHFWLISPHKVKKNSIEKFLPKLNPKDKKLKESLLQNTKQKEKIVKKFISYARYIPGIRLIALTGSVAVNNSKKNDDLDLLIITSPNTLWLVRPLLLVLLSIKFNRRHPGDNKIHRKNAFCPNLWLDALSLTIPKSGRNLYTAHEVLQVRPVLDRGHTFQLFIKKNSWTKKYLANAFLEISKGSIKKEETKYIFTLTAPFNFAAYILQYIYMFPKKTNEKVSLHSAFFHKNNPSALLMQFLNNKSV